MENSLLDFVLRLYFQVCSYFRLLKMADYIVEERGSRNSLEYRMFIKDGSGKPISAMHDIPMLASELP